LSCGSQIGTLAPGTVPNAPGLVERCPDPNDRRGKLIALTDAGERVIDETIGRDVANKERLLSVLRSGEMRDPESGLPDSLAERASRPEDLADHPASSTQS
jgi:hypothetical protein